MDIGAQAHWMDIGAREPGEATDSTKVYQEGFQLGPTHLYRAGEPVPGFLDFLASNSRLPNTIRGNMAAVQ